MGRIRLNKYNIKLTIRRLIGITILFILGYWAFSFAVKLIFYILYAGTGLIDKFFKFLVSWLGASNEKGNKKSPHTDQSKRTKNL